MLYFSDLPDLIHTFNPFTILLYVNLFRSLSQYLAIGIVFSVQIPPLTCLKTS